MRLHTRIQQALKGIISGIVGKAGQHYIPGKAYLHCLVLFVKALTHFKFCKWFLEELLLFYLWSVYEIQRISPVTALHIPRTWTCSSGEHVWVYKNKSKAGHSINIQGNTGRIRVKLWQCWGLRLIFYFYFASFWWAGRPVLPLIPELCFHFLLSKCFPALITFLRGRELDIVWALSPIKCTPKRSSKWDFQGRSFGLYCGLFVLQKVRVKKKEKFFLYSKTFADMLFTIIGI